MPYLDCILDPEKHTKKIREIVKSIGESQIEFDFIAIRGMSGAIVAGPVSLRVKKPIVIIRKNEKSHGYPIENPLSLLIEGKKYIILDDGIGTGETIGVIVNKLNDRYHNNVTCVGIFLYAQTEIDDDLTMERMVTKLEINIKGSSKNILIVDIEAGHKISTTA